MARQQEIDHHTIKLIVGIVAITLAPLTDLFATEAIASISASYYEGGWSQSIFVGFLFAIAAFLMAYNGYSSKEMTLSKVASLAALGVALFPCECGGHPALLPYVHGASAATMFLILAYFCHCFYKRARVKGYPQAKLRAAIYVACGMAILSAVGVLAIDHFSGNAIAMGIPRLVFYGEATGLVAFGVSWLTASRMLPLLTSRDERISPFGAVNPT